MVPPTTLLRDTALIGAPIAAAIALAGGRAAAAGWVFGWVDVAFWAWVVVAFPQGGGKLALRWSGKLIFTVCLFGLGVTSLSPMAFVTGFMGSLFLTAACAIFRAETLKAAPLPSPLEVR